MPSSFELAPICRPIVQHGRELLSGVARAKAFRQRPARPLRLLTARAGSLAAILERHGCDPRAKAVVSVPPGLIWRHALRVAGYLLC